MRRFKPIHKKTGILLGVLCLLSIHLAAQQLPANGIENDNLRLLQLKGQLDSTYSFNARPLDLNYLNDYIKSKGVGQDSLRFLKSTNSQKLFAFKLLPFKQTIQLNTHHPYGWNDGNMIPAKGWQTLSSLGAWFKVGLLSIQLQPEWVYAQNSDFKTFNQVNYFGYTDQPQRFGNTPYQKLDWGQSYIQLQVNKFALKLSNQNLWYGPGYRNSLLMSNNSSNFKHIDLNSLAPIKTPIGSLEFEFLAGKLTSSAQDSSNNKSWRYLASLNLSYQPKWIPGLFLGLTRSFQAYHQSVNTLSEYIPFFFPYQKINTNDGDPIPRDQLTSLYSRWLFQKSHAEIYFEYGLNDNALDFRDFLGSPQHSRAYLFGIKKLFLLNSYKDNYISFHTEVTQMSQTPDRIVRDAGSWYYHGQVLQGYTNNGQVIGAGIGSGGDLQTIEIQYMKGLKHIGFRFERYVHNKDYYNAIIGDRNGKSRSWVDLSYALIGQWQFGHLLLNTELNYIHSLNYQWIDLAPTGNYYPIGKDVNNFHGVLGLSYYF